MSQATWYPYLLTPWFRVLLEKLTGLQLVNKFPAFHRTRRFITAHTSVRHLSVSWAKPIQSIYPHPTSWRSILILSTHLRLGLPSGSFPPVSPPRPYTPLSFPSAIRRPRHICGRPRLKCDGTRAETKFRLSAKRTNPFKLAGASVQSTTGSRGVRISGSNAGYTMFRVSVKGSGYPLHSLVSPSLPLLCVIVCHYVSAGLYLNCLILDDEFDVLFQNVGKQLPTNAAQHPRTETACTLNRSAACLMLVRYFFEDVRALFVIAAF